MVRIRVEIRFMTEERRARMFVCVYACVCVCVCVRVLGRDTYTAAGVIVGVRVI